MTWLRDLPSGGDDWERISRVLPTQFNALTELHRTLWAQATDPVLLELIRLRMAQMLRCDAALKQRTPAAVEAGLSEQKAAAVAEWTASALFSDRERGWLAFTEQWMGDVNGITDELFEPLLKHNTPAECNQIIFSMWPIEQSVRLTALLGLDESPELHWAPANGEARQ